MPVQLGFHWQPESAHALDVKSVEHELGVPVQDVPKTQPAILAQAVASAAALQSVGVPEQLLVEKQPLAPAHCCAERAEQAVALPVQTRAPPEPLDPALAPPLPALRLAPPIPALAPPLPPLLVPPLVLEPPAPEPELPAVLISPAWPAFSTPESPAVALPPSPSPAMPAIPPLASPAALLAPAALCPALLLPAFSELPAKPSLVPSLEPQFTTAISTDGTRINQPTFRIF